MQPGRNLQFDKFTSLCLQGRCAEALKVARKIETARLPLQARQRVHRFVERFSSQYRRSNTRDPIRKVIGLFEEYWHQSLLTKANQRRLDQQLTENVREWLWAVRGVKTESISAETVDARLKKEIEAMGYFCITGTIAHLRELEIWRKQREVTKTVELPETTERVKTYLMSGFLTKGWMAYASMGRYYPGGWAKKEGLYCNIHAYHLRSEKFLVSYLAHESQHYSDYKRYPKLGEADLEYRAKLAEFALAKRTSKRMYQVFASRADYNVKNPHAFSYFCVVRDLAKEIQGDNDFLKLARQPHLLKPTQINRAARTLMARHSLGLRARGAKRVRSLIR